MAVERSEFEFHVRTAQELAGAEEGAGELERAIGNARALGRDCAGLERRLARVREGARQFRLAHPGLAEAGVNGEREERENESLKENFLPDERGAANGGLRRRPDARSGGERETDEVAETGATGPGGMEDEGATTGSSHESGGLSEAAQSGWAGGETDDAGGGNADWTEGAEPPTAETEEAGIAVAEVPLPVPAPERDAGMSETVTATAGAEPLTWVWTARMQGAVEQTVREAMSKRERVRAGMGDREEERLEELELRLRRVEERGRVNRDAG